MRDFAKLFVADGIGQILITTTLSDEGYPSLTCRIPNTEDTQWEVSASVKLEDTTAGYEHITKLFDEMTLKLAIDMAKPLIKARDIFASGDDLNVEAV